ncbi:3-oxoacid CoA-transferase subunit A [Pikeienuella sp. HZG-20]|uniref:3-oxoacid CoA-transferase subunit A n=1 Tax=Paludibacillus litoralis TaxID=3133267 RepID=UPI0030EC43EC
MTKPVTDAHEAVAGIGDGAVVMTGGFGGAGIPIELTHALLDQGARGLTIVNNNGGTGRVGIAALIDAGRVEKVICSYPRTSDSRAFREKYLAGKIELELVPQGVLAERIRAGGAGIPAFFTSTGAGTELAAGKETRVINGVPCVLEPWLRADFAFVKAEVADRYGNLTYRLTARNFGPIMCMAADCSIVQVRKVVEPGGIDPEHVITPGIFVDRIALVPDPAQEEDLVARGVAYP